MSRCFPFPPPGYERKLITDDPDLLKKEKHREKKKHKKDKKEKKDRKEKKEKDRSEGKHKEKKDKHRDKKKDKEKSETSGSLDIYGQPKGFNGELIHHNNGQNKEKFNGDLLINKIKVGSSENCKFVQDLDRRIRDEEKGTSSHQFVVQKTDGLQMGGNVAVPGRVSGSNVAVPGRVNGATPVPLDNRRIEKKVERDKNKQIMKTDLENSYLGVGNEGNIRKRKDMETNGVSHEKELRPNKMARPVSNISPENGKKPGFSQNPGQSLLDKPGASHPHNSFKVGTKGGQKVNGMITAQPASVPAKKPPIPASPIKSPPVTTNHHVPTRSSPVPTSKPQPNHIASAQPSTSKPPPLIPKPVTPHRQPHHLSPSPPPPPPPPTTSQQPPVPRPKPPPPPLPIPKKKLPHPDTKYLNQILSVPKLDQWCGFPDQEWLYNSKAGPAGPISKKRPVVVPEVQVWSEAKHIESADVFALPYVIPY